MVFCELDTWAHFQNLSYAEHHMAAKPGHFICDFIRPELERGRELRALEDCFHFLTGELRSLMKNELRDAIVHAPKLLHPHAAMSGQKVRGKSIFPCFEHRVSIPVFGSDLAKPKRAVLHSLQNHTPNQPLSLRQSPPPNQPFTNARVTIFCT